MGDDINKFSKSCSFSLENQNPESVEATRITFPKRKNESFRNILWRGRIATIFHSFLLLCVSNTLMANEE